MSNVKAPEFDLKDRAKLTENSRLFEAWFGDNREAITEKQVKPAEYVRLSFNTIKLNKSNAPALQSVWHHHDRIVDDFLASLEPEQHGDY